MPYQDKPIEKKYYTIGEVASRFKVNTSLIRFWEKEFDIISPRKNKKGNRQFTKEDIENVALVYHLVKERGMTLEGAKTKIKLDKKAVKELQELNHSLHHIRDFLVNIKKQLDIDQQ